MTKVFVMNKSGHDFSAAVPFGDLVFCTEGMIDKFAVNTLYRIFQEKMRDAAEDDFILPTSLSILTGIASGIMCARFGRVRFLLFRGGQYIERSLQVD